jgi:hypothetical protein
VNKRSAVTIAGGVAGALISGVAGYTARSGEASAAQPSVAPSPIVKTEVRTITIHRKAKPKPGVARTPATVVIKRAPTVARATAPATHHTGGSAAHGDDDEHEHGDGGDD